MKITGQGFLHYQENKDAWIGKHGECHCCYAGFQVESSGDILNIVTVPPPKTIQGGGRSYIKASMECPSCHKTTYITRWM